MKRMMMMAVAAGLVLAGCASSPDDPNKHTKEKAAAGAAIGAIAGAVIGHQQDRSGGALRGALIGAAAGGAIGAGVGRYMDNQQAEFNRVLAEERRANQVEIERLKNENLKITMNSEVSFDYNSAQLKPAFNSTLDKVADILNRYPRTTIRITGHTDSRGSTEYNQNLSQQRANSVAWYLADRGVDSRRVIAEGRGEMQPRATNDTEAGRQLNRRVEMLIIPDNDIQ
ncbi:Outer membrane protein OmpA [Mariprofundus ferrinatatus]|uniref:Outer membrane protein OmpA n=1 Tax=Mariprofundus ferrinatatus TaxID=1921087 RepID=A0A2K8L1B2_9PROT|nr:OmpA family protein [Mariprofundus ferrinatatus]ATX81105.1 Outer membrane protein OmpA [Mariprofundus ferrinatatus]